MPDTIPSSRTITQPYMSDTGPSFTCGCGYTGTFDQIMHRHPIPGQDKDKHCHIDQRQPQGRTDLPEGFTNRPSELER